MPKRLPEFDELVDLARNQPEELEALRLLMIEDVINSASSEAQRRRLEGLQFKVDMERRRAASPLAATIKLSEMMCQSLADLHRSLITPMEQIIEPVEEAIAGDAHGPVAAARHGAKILPFVRTIERDDEPDLI